IITIFPALSISTRAICTPAAATALTALVTSCCRNVEGARAMGPTEKSSYRRWSKADPRAYEGVPRITPRAQSRRVVFWVEGGGAGRGCDRAGVVGQRRPLPTL